MLRSRSQAGFTLIELMIVVVLLSIAISIALPGFSRQIANSRVQAATQELYGLLQYARTEAVMKNRRTGFCTADTQAWRVARACSGASDTKTLREVRLPDGVIAQANGQSLEFSGNGSADRMLSIVICDRNHSANAWELSVTRSGYISQHSKGDNVSCRA